MLSVPPVVSVEMANVADPELSVPVPSTVFPCLNVTVSPFGGTGVTTALKVTVSPYVDGFSDEESVVVVNGKLRPKAVPNNKTVMILAIFMQILASHRRLVLLSEDHGKVVAFASVMPGQLA